MGDELIGDDNFGDRESQTLNSLFRVRAMASSHRPSSTFDDPGLSPEDRRLAWAGIAKLNRFSGIASVLYRRLRRYIPEGTRTLKVLDVASGAGDIPIRWAVWAKAEGFDLRLQLVDACPLAAENQQDRAAEAGVEVNSFVADPLRDSLPGGADVVTCNSLMHRLDELQIRRTLTSIMRVGPQAVLISDLNRSNANVAMVTAAGRAFSRCGALHRELDQAIRTAYTAQEFSRMAEKILLRPVRVEECFPCRYLLTVDDEQVSIPLPAFAV